ncbi:YceD family protein [Candidatus Palauibacter sp.]|uniref:YceD family protein n=1 Tax=Candidatus Palauibacter sp. TaxID=3101350 RepID=UPI003AF229AD
MKQRRDRKFVTEPTRIGLAGLDEGPIERTLRLEVPREPLGELPLAFERVDLEVEIRRASRDGVRVRGRLAARTTVACRRCLAPTRAEVVAEWDVMFRPSARITPGEEGVWALEAEAGELDLAGPVREELWVHAPAWVECSAECPGLCPGCGARLADESCDCPPPGPDPRWAALENLGG